MRTIELTNSFKRDYKKVAANPRHRQIDSLLALTMRKLAMDIALEPKFRDHLLSGEYKNHRECHLKPDPLLVYKKPDEETVTFVRFGSHSELF
jgi:mRNA interferase YafQ